MIAAAIALLLAPRAAKRNVGFVDSLEFAPRERRDNFC